MKFEVINGFTIESMKDMIRNRNNDHKCMNYDGSICIYHNYANDNHCAVGVFIPDEIKLDDPECGSNSLFRTQPELLDYMPLAAEGMHKLQLIHDGSDPGESIHDRLFSWIDEFCFEA